MASSSNRDVYEKSMQALQVAVKRGDFEAAERFKSQAEEYRPVEFNFNTMVGNIPQSAARTGEAIYNAATNPLDTLGAVSDIVTGTAHKAMRSLAEVTTGKDIKPMGDYEQAVDAVADMAVDRYGSVDAIKSTLMEDPVGAAVDVASLLTPLKIPVVSKVAALVDPINLAKATAKMVGKAIPKRVPRKLYDSSAKFGTTIDPKKRAEIVDTALREGVAPNIKGLDKVESRINTLNNTLDDLITDSVSSGKEIPVGKIFQHLKKLRRTKGGVRIGNTADLGIIDRIAGEFQIGLKGRKTVTPEELQFFKKEAYKTINWNARNQTGEQASVATQKAMARGAKDAISEAIPEASGINKQLGDLYALQEPLERATARVSNRNIIGLDAAAKLGAGGVVGGGGGAMTGAMVSALGNPKVKARVAVGLEKLRMGDTKWLKSNLGTTELRLVLAIAGREEL